MSSFLTAMDTHAVPFQHRTSTENGRPSVSTQGVGDARVGAFFKLVRGLSREALCEHVEAIMRQAETTGDVEALADLFVLWASTRDVRGGKGERSLANQLIVELGKHFPRTVEALLPLVPEYGSWRDVTLLLEETQLVSSVRQALVALFAEQLKADFTSEKPSLAGKWAPREGSAHAAVARELAGTLFPDVKHPKPLYRKALAALNRTLGTVEVKMCAGEWQSIQPSAVPAQCLTKTRKALMNLKIQGSGARSEEEDRVKCAEQFVEYAEQCRKDPKKASMHGRVLHPHEMVNKYLGGRRGGCAEEDPILEAQWVDLRERTRAEVSAEGAEEGRTEKGALGKMVPLVDVSGSMDGTPMEVAIALGLLISELAHPAVRDRFLTFETEPRWHAMDAAWSLHQKVRSAEQAPWGGSTDFSKALRLLLDACVAGGVPPTDVGELQLVVLSDMQFNTAAGLHGGYGGMYGGYGGMQGRAPRAWETQYKELVRDFAEAGLRSQWKEAYPVPRVIFWNLRGDTGDFPVSSDTPGVDMVSGFSPNLLKLFLEGSLDEAMEAMGVQEEGKPKRDPMVTVRKALDDERYLAVREVCASVGEGAMAGYVAPQPALEADAGALEDFVVV